MPRTRLGQRQLAILRALESGPAKSVHAIGDATDERWKQYHYRTVYRLAERGLVRIAKPTAGKGRGQRVSITRAGRTVLAERTLD